MIAGVYCCPICGELILYDNENDKGLIIIKTKRRSTVIVHKYCYQNNLNKRGDRSNEH